MKELIPNGIIDDDGDILPPEDGLFEPVFPSESLDDHSLYATGLAPIEAHSLDLDTRDIGSGERAARQMMLREQLGFYAHGKRELAQATALAGDTYRKNAGGAAKFLNEVLNHQLKVVDKHENDDPPFEPSKALRSIVREWEQNAESSRGALTALEFLQQDIAANGDINRFTGLGNLSQVRDWPRQDWTRRAIAVMVRQHDTDRFVYEAAGENLDINYESVSDKDILAHEANYLKGLRVGDAEKLIPHLASAHTKRLRFWLDRIDEARSHTAVRAQAAQALEKYQTHS